MNNWHITKAEYVESEKLITEKRIADFSDFEMAKKYFLDHDNLPIYLWHDCAVGLDNPYFAIMETDAFKQEYYKIKGE